MKKKSIVFIAMLLFGLSIASVALAETATASFTFNGRYKTGFSTDSSVPQKNDLRINNLAYLSTVEKSTGTVSCVNYYYYKNKGTGNDITGVKSFEAPFGTNTTLSQQSSTRNICVRFANTASDGNYHNVSGLVSLYKN